MKFNERLKSLRLNSPQSQKELAEHLGVTPRTILRYEDGSTQPSIESIIKIAKYYHVSADYLIGSSADVLPSTAAEELQTNLPENPTVLCCPVCRSTLSVSIAAR